MEPSSNNFSGPEKIPTPFIGIDETSPEVIEFEPKFKQHQEDLRYMFNINVDDEKSLSSEDTKDKMYEKIIEDFNEGKPFTLDYMFEEGLLTREDLQERGIKNLKHQALDILKALKGPRLTTIRNLFINTGILTEEETEYIH